MRSYIGIALSRSASVRWSAGWNFTPRSPSSDMRQMYSSAVSEPGTTEPKEMNGSLSVSFANSSTCLCWLSFVAMCSRTLLSIPALFIAARRSETAASDEYGTPLCSCSFSIAGCASLSGNT